MTYLNDGIDGREGFDPALPPLCVEDLHVEIDTPTATVTAAGGVTFRVQAGRTLAILGESGSGKSMTARAVMGILPQPGGRVSAGRISVHGVNLLDLSARQRRRVRGGRVAMVFQDALSALNPVLSVGYQIGEAIRAHRRVSGTELRRRVVELLELVRIPAAQRRVRDYPHQLSGGMRQRVMIAMSLAADPEVLIADEPTTALDVTVQAQIMQLLVEIQQQRRMSLVLITHDLAVAAQFADDVAVMYAGRVVESGPLTEVFAGPAHPYTRALQGCVPQHRGTPGPLLAIEGVPPDLARLPGGCAFRPRCPQATPECHTRPPESRVTENRNSSCHHWQEVLG